MCQKRRGNNVAFWDSPIFPNSSYLFQKQTMFQMYVLVILLLIILLYQHICSHSPAVFTSFPLICMESPHFPSQACHRGQTEFRAVKANSLFGIQMFLSFTADAWLTGTLRHTQFVIWDGRHFILTELKQEMESGEKKCIRSIANRPLQFGMH